MVDIFELGDKVYHKNLKLNGTFDCYDWASDDSCFVCFEDESGDYDDCRCVSLNQLIRKEN